MAANFVHSVLVEEQDPAADAILTHDLPVNPLSAILIHLKPLNETATITAFQSLAGILDAINEITITRQGIILFEASGRDAYQLLRHRWHKDIVQNGHNSTNNSRRSLVLPILFGRHLLDPDEGLPASTPGKMQISLDIDVASGGYDDFRYSIETIELPGATFNHFSRVTRISQTFPATGRNDLELPIGSSIRGVLLFQTTGYAGATPAPGLGRLSVLKDGIQQGYMSTDVEVTRAIATLNGMPPARYDEHEHWAVIDDTVDVFSEPSEVHALIDDQYVYLDFDHTRDDRYILETASAQRVVIRSNANVAEAMRALTIEKFPVANLKP